MRKICVFAGSNLGERPEFKEQAIQLGKMFVENEYELVYGGSCVGLMGEVANEVLRLGGRVTGVILARSIPRRNCAYRINRIN